MYSSPTDVFPVLVQIKLVNKTYFKKLYEIEGMKRISDYEKTT